MTYRGHIRYREAHVQYRGAVISQEMSGTIAIRGRKAGQTKTRVIKNEVDYSAPVIGRVMKFGVESL